MYEKQIMRGAHWLDTRIKNWESAVNLKTLDLATTRHCILGQAIDGGYSLEKTWQACSKADGGFVVNNGFGIRSKENSITVNRLQQYTILTAEWRAEIRRRRKIKKMMQDISDAVTPIEVAA